MPPRKYVQQSQVHVYKTIGTGGRARLKMVPVPKEGISTATETPDLSRPEPPTVLPPDFGGEQNDRGNQPGLGQMDFEFPKKRKGKTQNDYMKVWLQEKREMYLQRILAMKGGPQSRGADVGQDLTVCPRCHVGRPVWRCLDCTEKTAVCVLCCRNDHKLDVFHRIEKWNGRFYQRGALWQVGAKIYAGHHGSPCPRSAAALSSQSGNSLAGRRYEILSIVDLSEIAAAFRKTHMELLQIISDCIDHPLGLMTELEQNVLNAIALRSGVHILDLMKRLKAAVAVEAEEEANELQDESDRATVAAEQHQQDLPAEPHVPLDIPLEDDLGNDNEWEDEDRRPSKAHLARFIPRPPPRDGAGNPFLTIVHTNGFHSLPVVWCACAGHQEDRDLQLLDLRLYPSSYDQIGTVFTFTLLDDHRYEYLECKTSRYQYHNKLRRMTCPEQPDASPNRYAELGRVSRQWRNLKYRRWFWLLNSLNVQRGAMALFCAACPQPGVNLPPDWEQLYLRNPAVFMRSFVADGNFKAIHHKQPNDNLDVHLSHGEAFMTNDERYKAHLETAEETKMKPTCHRHRAQLNAEVTHNTADVTGVGGHACARHGCFCPSSLVNFQKGEKQMNMDWSLTEALATTNIGCIKEILHIYDCNCQYCVHLRERINRNPHLHIAEHIELSHAIGLFHVHGHKDECLYRWATNYVPGAGVIDGEVLETLWSVLNTVSSATRTASLAHRAEILDDHMNDNNWKKLLHIVKTIVGRYNRALENVVEARLAFASLNDAAPAGSVDIWEATIREAEAARIDKPSSMDIMQSKIKTGQTLNSITAAIRRDDGLSISAALDNGDATDWLLEGFLIEDEQIRIRQLVRAAGRYPTDDQTQEIESKRQRIAARVRDFHITSVRLLGQAAVTSALGIPDRLNEDGYVSDDARRAEDQGIPVSLNEVENIIIVFPSVGGVTSPFLADLKTRECRLRRAKANDTLGHVRETLSGLSYQYIRKIRQAKTTKEHLRSWRGVKLLSMEVSFFQQVYNRNSHALRKLDPTLKQRYPRLRREDCTISTAIADVNAHGQSQVRLSWVWAAQDGWDGEASAASNSILDDDRLLEFYRVNWMRARAQRNRWEEEFPRTENEMIWTTLYFMHQRDVWYSRLQALPQMVGNSPGHEAYCQQKISHWEEFARIAEHQFKFANPDFPTTWRPIVTAT